MSIREVLGKQLIIADGAMGTQLQEKGLSAREVPIHWNITHPNEVREVHQAYLAAGARLIAANTFGAHARALVGTPYTVEEIVTAGVILAREARDEQEDEAYIALDIGSLGELLKPLGQIPFDEAIELYKEQITFGVAAGVDVILIETMIDTYDLKAAVLAAQEISDLPLFATVSIDEKGRLLNGADLACVCTLLEGLGVDALGLNCGAGPQEAAEYVAQMRALTSMPLMMSPNAGLPVIEGGSIAYHTSPDEFAQQTKPLVAGGYLAVAGGCCGTTPAHIQALADVCKDMVPNTGGLIDIKKRRVSSYASSLDLDPKETRIDRCIDTRTNEALAKSLAQGMFEHAIQEAFVAQDEGAEVVGVCVQSSEIDEYVTLPALIEHMQTIIRLPLLVITADLGALERSLKVYNGCALVDLSSFTSAQKEAAIAVAARYGAVQI